jgi:predicted  nucleic acid-binding Zn-ribbon protein
MNELQAILIVVAFALGVAAFYFAQRAAQTRAELRKSQELARSREQQVEAAEKKLENRNGDVDQLKRQLQDTRNKVDRLKKDIHAAKTQAQSKARADEAPSPDSAAKKVRVSSQELEAEHRRRVEKLEAELKRARDEAEALRKKEKARAAEAEKAKRALLAEEGLDHAHAAPSGDLSPEARIDAMRARLDALQTAAATRERELKKKLNRAESDARAAQKRASNNHALYLVIKGQLEVAEDRLALLRRKYEGAKRPNELTAAAPLPEESKPNAPVAAPGAAVEDVAALATTEPAANDSTGEVETALPASETQAPDADSPEKS